MKRPYSWGEINDLLVRELKKTKHIMTWGTIGSCNVDHDIDTIITKKPSSKTSDFYKEVHNLFSLLDEYLRNKYNSGLVTFNFSFEEFFIRKLSKGSSNYLFLHTMIYVSYNQFEKDWSWAILPDDSVKRIISENYSCLIGSTDQIFGSEFTREIYYYSLYNYLYLYDKINSKLSTPLLLEVMNHAFDYVYRKRLGLKTPVAKNVSDVKKYFYKLCDEIDKAEALKAQ